MDIQNALLNLRFFRVRKFVLGHFQDTGITDLPTLGGQSVLIAVAAIALPVVAWSELTLGTTGCGLPPGSLTPTLLVPFMTAQVFPTHVLPVVAL